MFRRLSQSFVPSTANAGGADASNSNTGTNNAGAGAAAAGRTATATPPPGSPSRRPSSLIRKASSFLSPTPDEEGPGPNASTSTSKSTSSSSSMLSTSASNHDLSHELEDLTSANTLMITSLEAIQFVHRSDLRSRLELLRKIEGALSEHPDTKNTFRESGGFLTLVSLLASLEGVGGGGGVRVGAGGREEEEEDVPSVTYGYGPRNTVEAESNQPSQCLVLVRSIFSILSRSIVSHDLNRHNFIDKVGFDSILDAIRLSDLLELGTEEEGGDGDVGKKKRSVRKVAVDGLTTTSKEVKSSAREHVFSILYSFLIGDVEEHSSTLFVSIHDKLREALSDLGPLSEGTVIEVENRQALISQFLLDITSPTGGDESVKNPEIVPVMFALLRDLGESEMEDEDRDLCYAVYAAVERLASGSRRNQVVMNQAGNVGIVLRTLFPPPPMITTTTATTMTTTTGRKGGDKKGRKSSARDDEDPAHWGGRLERERQKRRLGREKCSGEESGSGLGGQTRERDLSEGERIVLTKLAHRLLEMGVSTEEIRFMFMRVVVRDQERASRLELDVEKEKGRWRDEGRLEGEMLDLILSGIRQSRWPSFIHFDLSRFGHSSLELRSVGPRPFPPTSSGYTFMAWIQIATFDPKMNLTILSLQDASQKCNVSFYIDKDTQSPILQTSSSRTTKFNNFKFGTGKWYHVAIVHHRPRVSSTSGVSLFVDGQLVEVGRATWPSQPAAYFPVQGFFGTPKSAVGSEGLKDGRRSGLKWNLGPTWLIDGDLSEDMIYVCSTLGPRYSSNFQDSLGQFQTYETSTCLNIRIDALQKAGTLSNKALSESPLVNAIRGKGSRYIPENRIYFAFTAINVLAAGSSMGISGSGLSEHAMQTLALATASRGKVIVNSAIPKLDQALIAPQGLAFLHGDPIVANPRSLDVAVWKIGGMSVALRGVELARDAKELERAVCIFTELVLFSWRNSEDAERIQAYEILALLLRGKAELISETAFHSLLAFVGWKQNDPTSSVIANPLAYRFILLDFQTWLHTDIEVQTAHLYQLRAFIHQNNHAKFNTRRLSRMHVPRKMLHALRLRLVKLAVLPAFGETLRHILRALFTTDTIRHIATYLTATLCQVPASLEEPRRFMSSGNWTISPVSVTSTMDRSIITNVAALSTTGKEGLVALEALHTILMEASSGEKMSKFADTITSKWILLFFEKSSHPESVLLSLRLLGKLLFTQGPSYLHKFRISNDGFRTMRYLLPEFWNFSQIISTLFAIFIGLDMSDFNSSTDLAADWVLTSLKTPPEYADEMLSVIVACIHQGLRDVASPLKEGKGSEPGSTDLSQSASEPVLMEGSGLKPYLAPLQTNGLPNLGANLADSVATEAQRTAQIQHLTMCIDLLTAIAGTSPDYAALMSTPVFVDMVSEAGIQVVHSLSDDNLEDRPHQLESGPFSAPPAPLFDEAPDKHAHADSTPETPSILVLDQVVASPSDAMPATAASAQSWTTTASSPGPLAPSTLASFSQLPECLIALISFCIEHAVSPPRGIPVAIPLKDFLNTVFSPSKTRVIFQTRIVLEVCKGLESRPGSNHKGIQAFIQKGTELVFDGFVRGAHDALISLCFSLLDSMLDVNLLESPSSGSEIIGALFSNLNRLVLFSMSADPSTFASDYPPDFLDRLIFHQLTMFAPQNTDVDFFASFAWRLNVLLQLIQEEETRTTAANLFKLLVLQRPADINLAGMDEESQVPLQARLVDTDAAELPRILRNHQAQLAGIRTSWEDFVNEQRSLSFARWEKARRKQAEKRRERSLLDVRRKNNGKKLISWCQSVHDIETSRLSNIRQDLADHASFVESEWARFSEDLFLECSLWADPLAERQWRLDFTEGPHRIRKMLAVHVARKHTPKHRPVSRHGSDYQQSRNAGITRQNTLTPYEMTAISPGTTVPHTPISPGERDGDLWEDLTHSKSNGTTRQASGSEPSGPGADDQERAALDPSELEEDKNRKVLRCLEPGDSVLSVYNINRIAGLDARAGLLLLGKKKIYIVDDFFQKADGEVVDAWDAPADERDPYLQSLAEAAPSVEKNAVIDSADLHRSRKWYYDDLLQVWDRKYLFRAVALELFFADGRSFLLTFRLDEREIAMNHLISLCPAAATAGDLQRSRSGSGTLGSNLGSKMSNAVFGKDTHLSRLTRSWERREISNFAFMGLNTLAGRSYNDLTQYPVFPWIIADYDSDELDLSKPATFRDLTKPIGAQSEDRRKEFEDRFSQLSQLNDASMKPFHYGTHYSSAMIVCGYLIRLQPFTQHFLELQGGTFDHADRMFWSIGKAWDSSSRQNRSDVRELIPEFFFLPEFLVNSSGIDFGRRQESDEPVDNVALPPWAKGDPHLFIKKQQEALESEYVDQNLHHWIDLIFGYKQSGEAAVKAVNVFHSLSYEGAIDLDKISDPDERKAATSTIHNFGQTPKALFTHPHPKRVARRPTNPAMTEPFDSQPKLLIQSLVPIRDVGQQVNYISSAPADRMYATTVQSLAIPSDPLWRVHWGYADQSMRLISPDGRQTLTFESMPLEFFSCACFVDSRILVTGATDTTVQVWKWRWREERKDGGFQHVECLRGHAGSVTCVAGTRAFSIIVSGSEDRTAIIWHLNNLRFVRKLGGHEDRVQQITISDETGHIATCCAAKLRLWTVNGDLIASVSTSQYADPIRSCAFSKGPIMPLIITGHRNGKIMIWKAENGVDSSGRSAWSLCLVRSLYQQTRDQMNPPDITALSTTSRSLYAGDANGRVFMWSPPGTDFFVPDATSPDCMQCGNRFGLVEARKRCISCAGLFCSRCCAETLPGYAGRFCASCASTLKPFTA